MIKFHSGLMRTNLEYIVFIMYQDRHFQTGEFLRKASKNNEELETIIKIERLLYEWLQKIRLVKFSKRQGICSIFKKLYEWSKLGIGHLVGNAKGD